MRVVFVVLVAFLVVSCKPVSRLMDTVVLIRDITGHGSGVMISPTLVLTNKHVSRGGAMVIEFRDGKTTLGKLLWKAEHNDLALFEVDRQDRPTAAIACRAPKPGEPIMAIGHPIQARWAVSHGYGSSDVELPSPYGPVLPIDVEIYPGNSGGPIFDKDGNIIGLAVAIMGATMAGGGVSVIVPGSEICRYLVLPQLEIAVGS